MLFERHPSTGVLRRLASVAVGRDLSVVVRMSHETLRVISDIEHQVVCGQSFVQKVERQTVRHFHEHDESFFGSVGTGEHLTAAERVSSGSVGFHRRH